MSLNSLEGAPVELDEFLGFEQDTTDLFLLGEIALEPLAEVDLASVANDVAAPQGDAVPTAAFNSQMSAVPAAFQSYVQTY